MNAQFTRRTRDTFLLLAAIPVLTGLLVFWAIHGYGASAGWVQHTQEVLTAISQIEVTLKDAEAHQRGYLITGDSDPLQSYRTSAASIRGQVDRLRALTTDNPAQQSNIARFAEPLDLKLRQLATTVEIRRTGHLDAAIANVRENENSRVSQEMALAADRMRDEEKRLLEERRRDQAWTGFALIAACAAAVLTTIGLILYAWRQLGQYRAERDRAEQEVRALNQDLEGRVTARTAELQTANAELRRSETVLAEMNENLKRSNHDLEQFAYVASHDLQEPLRMVASYVGLIERRYKGRLDGQADQYITYAVDGARRMQDLIRDLLAYSRAGSEGPRREEVDLEQVLARTLSNLEASIQEAGAQVVHDVLPKVTGDELKLMMVLQNLISNAIKFRKPGQAPVIDVRAERRGDEWRISVRDTGIGFEPQYANRIFGVFQRLHRASYPGTGIGLAIVKRIVEAHGGFVHAESKPGEGATFTFTLPVSGAVPAYVQ